MRNYLRMLTGLDRNIGRVMAELDKRGLADNTVILFMGDNGYYMGERGFAGKWSHYEQSLRVPLVMYDPRNTDNRGEPNSRIALNIDIAPTLLQLAGVALPARYQGVPLTQLDSGPERDGFRGKRYVYANYYEQDSDREFLHDLQTDPDQPRNLAKDPEYASVLAESRAKTERSSESYRNPTGR